jgi:hypothetical protein
VLTLCILGRGGVLEMDELRLRLLSVLSEVRLGSRVIGWLVDRWKSCVVTAWTVTCFDRCIVYLIRSFLSSIRDRYLRIL